MSRYTLTELNNRSGEVVEAAHSGPVEITSRGKRKFVIMTAADYDRLAGLSAQRVHNIAAMTQQERDAFILSMDEIAADADQPDG